MDTQRGSVTTADGAGGGQLADRAHAEPAQAVARTLDVDPAAGLDEREAATRRARWGPNALPPAPRASVLRRVLVALREPLTLLLVVAAAVAGLLLREVVDALAILAIVVLNTVIGLVEEGRAQRALEAVAALQTPNARVRREHRVRTLPADELVPGDVVLLAAGDRVPADLRLWRADGVEVDESTLTGESLPVSKDPAELAAPDAAMGERPGSALGGTLVMRGRAEGLVVATGARTALGRIADTLAEPQEATPLQRELAHLSSRLGVVAAVVASGVLGLILLLGAGDAEEAFLTAVALAVAAVPEGLATVTLVALALGVRRMAARGALVRRLPAVETLGSVSVMIVDKTGTLTENRMQPERLSWAAGPFASPGLLPEALRPAVEEVAALCNDAAGDPPTGDATEVALLALVGDPARVEALRRDRPRLAELGFDSERKRMAVLTDAGTTAGGGGAWTLHVKGAPEALLEACAHVLDADGRPVVLDATGRGRVAEEIARAAREGVRVLALAQRMMPAADAVPGREELAALEASGLTLVALVGLRDAVRRQASSSVADARAAGVHLVMATGDHPGTAAAVAVRVGLTAAGAQARTGATLRRDGIPDDPLTVPVYARVDPDQKLGLVDRLRERGHVVGMTGDGVNDAPALRRADIGVALGKRGSDVAREAADMVVTDDDLTTIVGAIREGRGIYDNIRKVVEYLVGGNLSEIAVVVAAVLMLPALGVPLLPLQLLWINLLTDGLPALALGVDPVEPDLMRRPPRPRGTRLLGARVLGRLLARAAVLAAGALGAALIADAVWGHAPDRVRTVLFTTLVVVHLLYAFVVRMPAGPVSGRRWFGTAWLVAAVLAGLGLQVGIVLWPPAHAVFATTALAAGDWLLVAGASVATTLLLAVVVRSQSKGSYGSKAMTDSN